MASVPKMAQDSFQVLKDGPETLEDGHQMAPSWPKMAQDGPKMDQGGLNMTPTWSQDAFLGLNISIPNPTISPTQPGGMRDAIE